MIINANKNDINASYGDIKIGECFSYNGDFYMTVYDENEDCDFAVNLGNGRVRWFDDNTAVHALTATVSFKEIQ